MSNIVVKFRSNLVKQQLIKNEDQVYVAVSGGPDSMALLHLFLLVRTEFHLVLRVLHFNHKLRGDAADQEEKFVRELARKIGLEAIVDSGEVREFARCNKLSLETAARKMRYLFFQKIVEQKPDCLIALGHHADDQTETILDRFFRGSGLIGMSGMRWRRDHFIRPMLNIRHSEILEYLDTIEAHYYTDPGNQDLRFRRNRIRHQLLPLLKKEFNPSIVQVINRSAEIFSEANVFLSFFAENALKECLLFQEEDKIILDIFKFLLYFTIVKKYIVFQVLKKFQIRPEETGTANLYKILELAQNKKTEEFIVIRGICRVGVWQNQLVFDRPMRLAFAREIDMNISVQTLHPGHHLRISKSEVPAYWNADPHIEYIDADKLADRIIVRTIRAGDRFYPIHMHGSKKISDYLIDKKVPYYRRGEIMVLESNNQIVWLLGARLDERFKITPNTQNIIKLEYIQEQ